MKAVKFLPTNILATSPHYGKILEMYNQLAMSGGKVNNKKFFDDIVQPLLPDYKIRNWYKFIERFKDAGGVMAMTANITAASIASKPFVPAAPQEKMLLSNQAATSSLIQNILNVSSQRAIDLANNPELLTHKEAVELGIKVMKAQDSRIHAVGKIREDNREQEKFDKAFDSAAFG